MITKRILPKIFIAGLFAFATHSLAGTNFKVNCCQVSNAPSWISSYGLSDIAAEMESELGWSIRRIEVKFHDSKDSFQRAANLSFGADAFFAPSQQKIEVAPLKDIEEFTPVFRHELAHVISNQKFKGGIPRWLEEGFANFVGSKRQVNYKWLAKQSRPKATDLEHPNSDANGSKVHYQLSTATMEMIANKCNLKDLLMLTTGAKMTSYLETFCKIKNVNDAVEEWILSKK